MFQQKNGPIVLSQLIIWNSNLQHIIKLNNMMRQGFTTFTHTAQLNELDPHIIVDSLINSFNS